MKCPICGGKTRKKGEIRRCDSCHAKFTIKDGLLKQTV